MSYVEAQCTPISSLKEQIKDGLYGDLKEVSDINLYRNAKRQWRLKFKVENDVKTMSKTINLLAAVKGETIFVNKNSIDFSVNESKEDADMTSLAEKLLL